MASKKSKSKSNPQLTAVGFGRHSGAWRRLLFNR